MQGQKQELNYTVYYFNALACLRYNFSSDNIYLVTHVFRGFLFFGGGGEGGVGPRDVEPKSSSMSTHVI